jgi:putative SOS response-associated peptidase YedK
MCNLYSMTRARAALLRLFRVSDNRAAAIEPKTAIFPGYVAPIVRTAEDGERESSPGRLRSAGMGETQAKADNETLAGRAINRRVEFRRLDQSLAGSRPLDAE